MAIVIGIDLGTTNFAISTIQNGKPKMLSDEQGHMIFPSAIFKQGDEWLVGHRAKTAMLKKPEDGAYAVKRLMGIKYNSDERIRLEQNIGLNIVPQDNGECSVVVADETLTPSQVASHILSFCRDIAVHSLGQMPDELVITVPAYFNHAQRQATKDAAELLGLECHRIINEPTAAAVAYGMKAADDSVVLVYDLGGGTFDVSILKFGGGIVETIATCGDVFLGGEDFDHRLVDYFVDLFSAEYEINLKEDPIAYRRLKDAAEKAKCELSFQESAMVFLPHIHGGKDLQTPINREQFEAVTSDLVDRSLEVVQTALEDAGLTAADIDQIVLVGGQTRMPLVQERITDYFKKEPSKGVHPDEVVATGAAIHASSLQGEIDAPMLFDVTPFDLGIDIQAGLFQKIIGKNSRIPTSQSKVFSTGKKGKTRVKIVVRQGQSRFAKENEFLGEFRVDNLKLREDGRGEVDILFRIDGNGMLNVTATDVISKRKVKIQMRNYGDFVREEIPPEPAPSMENEHVATVGLGDSSASGDKDNQTKVDLDDKVNSLKTLAEEASDKELQASSTLVDGLDQNEQEEAIDISAEIDAINSLIGTMSGKEETEENDGMSMALDLSWLDEFETQVDNETVADEPVDVQAQDSSSSVEEDDLETITLSTEQAVDPVADEPVFELIPEPDEDVFELVPEGGAAEPHQVEASDIEVVTDLLEEVLHSGFENDFHLPEDDFLSTLRAAVLGGSTPEPKKKVSVRQDKGQVKAPVFLDEPLELVVEDVQQQVTISPQMLLMLDELFED